MFSEWMIKSVPAQHLLTGTEQVRLTHLDTIEWRHTHVEEHTVEHRHGNELRDTEDNKNRF